ncbi:MAG: hypothetical protein KF754_07535 [Planctomycetes bacterium]|nr:hypothetical protein [Planctomycetota bacterium]
MSGDEQQGAALTDSNPTPLPDDEAPTPRRGSPAVARSGRGTRRTRGVRPGQWAGLRFVVLGLLLIAALVAGFVLLKAWFPAAANQRANSAQP